MREREFIESALESLHNEMPLMNIRYGYDASIDAHLIELTPLIVFASNLELRKKWIAISKEFNHYYKESTISFFSTDSLLQIEDVLFEKKGQFSNDSELLTMLYSNVSIGVATAIFPVGTITDVNEKMRFITNPIESNRQVISESDSHEMSYYLAA